MLAAALIPWGDGPLDEAGWVKTAPYNRVFQDWHHWRKEGLLDLTVPMNYDREFRPDQKAFFDHWIAFEKAYRHRSRLVIGLGAYMNRLADTEKQLQRALTPAPNGGRADGVCFFSYAAFRNVKPANKRPTLEDLRAMLVSSAESGHEAPFAKAVSVPTVTRLQHPTEGAVAGFATDSKGKPLDSQTVRLKSLDGKKAVDLLTDGNGFFAAVFVPPGRYRAVIPGQPQSQIKITPGKVAWLGNSPKE